MANFILDEKLKDTGTFHTDLTLKEIRTIIVFLHDLRRRKSEVKFLEIGVNAGGNIRLLKSVFGDIHYSGIDLFEDFQTSGDNTHETGTYTKEAVQQSVGADVTLYKGDSSVVVPTLQDKFDFIFIDGNHTYNATKIDFENSLEKLADGGFIGFHNCSCCGDPDFAYNGRDGGPWKVTQELKRSSAFHLEAEEDRIRVFSVAQR